MKIALAQINPIIGDFKYNFDKIEDFALRAKDLEADLVVFPEMSICGYPPKDLLEKRSFVDENLKTLERLIESIREIAVICGYVEINRKHFGNRLYNAVVFFKNGRIIGRYFKCLLPNYDVFDETRYFETEMWFMPSIYMGRRIGLTICEDIWSDEGMPHGRHYFMNPVADFAKKRTEIIINISASPFYAGKSSIRSELLSSIAKKYNVDVVYVNQVGANDSLIFDGLSCVWGKSGDLKISASEFEEDLVIWDNYVEERDVKRPDFSDDNCSILKALIVGTRDYVRKAGFSKAVIGLSGGIDSALTAAIAVEAVGNENVTGIFMPSLYTSRENYEDTELLAKNLGIRLDTISIDGIYQEFLKNLFFTCKDKPDVTEQNLQARIRGTILMAFSNKSGALVLTTGNKSELSVGYCTLYGDMSGGLAVISDVPKTVVYELSRLINKNKELIPVRIIQKAPSAELAPFQKDSDDLPPYEVLDAVLKLYIEEYKEVEEIAAEGFDKKLVEEIIARIIKNEYKRQQAPLGLKVTSKAFGSGRRYPIARGDSALI